MGCPPMIESLHFHRGYSLRLHKSKPFINYGIISITKSYISVQRIVLKGVVYVRKSIMHDQLTLAASQALLDRLVQYEQRIAHRDFPDDLLTKAHNLIMRTCTRCGTYHPITLLCQNKACQECRGYRTYILRR